MKTLIVAFICAGLVAYSAIQYVRSGNCDVSDTHLEHLLPELRELIETDQRLRKNIVDIRSNRFSHYDDISHDVAKLTTVLDRISHPYSQGSDNRDRQFKQKLEGIKQKLIRYESEIESLKTNLSAVRNSILYLPKLLYQSIVDIPQPHASSEVEDLILNMASVLDFYVSHESENHWYDELMLSISQLRRLEIQVLDSQLDQFEKHIGLIQSIRADINRGFKLTQNKDFVNSVGQLEFEILTSNACRLEVFTRLKQVLVAVILILFGISLFAVVRNIRQSRKLKIENAYRSRINTALQKLAEFDNRCDEKEFLDLCVASLVNASGCFIAFVAFFENEEKNNLKTASVFNGKAKQDNFVYLLKGAPCEHVLENRYCSVEFGAADLYPQDVMLKDLGIEAYFGQVLEDAEGKSIGLIALTYQRRTVKEDWLTSLIEVFATRISTELDRSQSAEALSKEREEAVTTLNSIADGVLRVDIDGYVTTMNPVARELLVIKETDTKAKLHVDDLLRFDRSADISELARQIKNSIKMDNAVSHLKEIPIPGKNSEDDGVVVNVSIAAIINKLNQKIGVIVVFHDISQELSYRQELVYHASHDNLTGLLNRRSLDAYFDELKSKIGPNYPCAMIYVDMDRFKVVNDTCGHTAGDDLLKRFSSLLGENIRERDFLARIGGDEFFIVIENCAVRDARQVANNILNSVRQFRFFWADSEFDVNASIGLTFIESTELDTSQIMSVVDQACLQAKSNGRNQISESSVGDPAVSSKKSRAFGSRGLTMRLITICFCYTSNPL